MAPIIAVLGGKGMLGRDLVSYLAGRDYQTRVYDLPEFDITSKDQLARALDGVTVVINCAAYTNVDAAEDASDAAFAVNAAALAELGQLARAKDIYVVHISTDFVFDGKSRNPYSEPDNPHPLGIYGSSKLKGEQELLKTKCNCAIMRVQWSYGRHGNNFITKFLERAKGNADLKVVDDQTGSPTWTMDMAQAIECLLRKGTTGFFHFANGGYATRYQAAEFIKQQLSLPNKLVPCSSAEYPLKAVRPRNSSFNTQKIQKILDHPIRPWQTALAEFLQS